nr:mite group 2 allergen Tyr p 2-like [Cherax quadricarinatus]
MSILHRSFKPVTQKLLYIYRSHTFHVYLYSIGRASETLKIEATAQIGNVDVPWPGIDTDGCQETTCPISAGTHVTWSTSIYIEREYPAISTVATFKLLNSASEPEVCFLIPIILV